MYLNGHTYFSLRYGTLSPEKLVEQARLTGASALALTDINNTSGVFDFIKACCKNEIHPIAGIEFRDDHQRFIGLAKNHKGFYELNKYLSGHTKTTELKPFTKHHFDHVFIIYPLGQKEPDQLKDYEYLGIQPREAALLVSGPLAKYLHKCVILHPVTIRNDLEYKIHKILRAVDENTTLPKIDTRYAANACETPKPYDQLLEPYQLVPTVIKNTERLIRNCHDDLDLQHDKNRRNFTKSARDDRQLLEKLAYEGFPARYSPNNKAARQRIGSELAIIHKMGFSTYFLITHDIISYGKNKGYHHVGRGSGANSIVAYCLGITDVDPIELDLYFERFINQYRASPPDFDIDFSWDERDDVIDYVFKRYGEDYTCLLSTYSTFKGRSIVREFGKAFGLPKEELDIIVKEPLAKHKHHSLAKQIAQYGNYVADFPNQLSIHAGGMLISEKPIYYYTPLQMMPKGFPVSHFDMHVAEEIHFHKYDVLSQRGIGHIKMAAGLVKENQGISIDVHQVQNFKNDPQVRKQLKTGKALGCFYIESPAMRGLLSKLRCGSYTQLVAASSIIRPGVAKSGMMKEYIRRFHNPRGFQYLHKTFREHLKETYGVMVYQEDVIKIAHYFGGLELEESDILRRIMSGKKRKGDRFDTLKNKFFKNCHKRGYSQKLTNEVWRQIESFAGYSFCKAHSASFAVESFQSLYLKTYYPLEFLVAVINNFGGFYRTEVYIHEARMAGATVEPPCVNNSHYLTTIRGRVIYLGFIHLKDMERDTARSIVKERKRHGPYISLGDFIHRTRIKRAQLDLLIRIGALRFTHQTKKELLWGKHRFLDKYLVKTPALPRIEDPSMKEKSLPPLEDHLFESAFEEIDLLGFPLTNPFDLLQTRFRGEVMAEDLINYVGKTVRMVGYYVTRKPVTTVHKQLMNFGCFIDVNGNFFDTVHFPPQLAAWPFKGSGCYLLKGQIVEEFEFPMMEVQKMARLPMVKDPGYL